MEFMFPSLYSMYPHAIFSLKACYIFFKGICFQHNNGEHMNNEIIKFLNGDLQIDVTVSPNEETVWLTQKQMAELFDVKSQAITRHLKNIYNDEGLFKETTCSKMEQVQIEGNRKITRKMDFYNLDAISLSMESKLFQTVHLLPLL